MNHTAPLSGRTCLSTIGLISSIGLILALAVTPQLSAEQKNPHTSSRASRPPEEVSYGRDIRPLLSDRCFLCHGPDQAARQADLRLDVRESATASAIVPGDSTGSDVVTRIVSQDPELRMPPPESTKRPLTREEAELIKAWIDRGAIYEEHWAFTTPRRPRLPEADQKDWNLHPIDRLVSAKLKSMGWTTSPRADRRTRLRRAALDLTGLPPTPEELSRFLDDDSPDAWARAVDRLLDSPDYGEHQTRFWLDVARYADSNGYQYDFQRDQWAWRDWVIHAFNQNMPFDQFTIEQLAGDLLPDATAQQRLATGFNRNHPITVEGGVIEEEYRIEYVIDRTTTTGSTWMGLTLGCARCHDHKFDPLSQREFYELSAYFNQVPEKGHNGFAPQEQIPSPLQSAKIAMATSQLADAQSALDLAVQAWNPDTAKIESEILARAVDNTRVASFASAESLHGADLEVLDDGVILVGGNIPARDLYQVAVATDGAPISGLRLILMPDDSTPSGGLGRSSNGNFVLSEIVTHFVPSGSVNNAEPIELTASRADFSQPGYDVSLATDGEIDSRGWAISGKQNEQLTADFFLTDPIREDRQGRLRLQLHFASEYAGHQFGKFQILLLRNRVPHTSEETIQALRRETDERTPEQQSLALAAVIRRAAPGEVQDAWQRLETARVVHQELHASVPKTMIMKDVDQPRGAYVLERGEYDKRGDHVQPNTPAMLPPMPAELPKNRLGFARWLMLPENPLTSRVAVNRFWIQMFGLGLNETPEDFGLQSAVPLQLELLDWLAVEFVESGWDVKGLLKTIVMSETYQQSSVVSSAALLSDPQNRYLGRGPKRRLDAESIRDAALSVSGLLNRTVGGPSVFPYHPTGLWMEVNNRPGFSTPYKQDSGDKLYRRSLYTYWKRTVPPPSMAVFDAPAREYCQVRRSMTNTPLQAFVLLHDPQFVEAARALAERMLLEGGQDLESQLRRGMELSVGRPPTHAELSILTETFRQRIARYQAHPENAKALLNVGQSPRTESLPLAQHAAMTSVARLILNLSEFITKG